MHQSRIESFVEAILNTLSGYLVSYLAWVWVAAPVLGLPPSQGQAFWVTNFFTILSILRSYIWRRFFNRRLHRAFAKRSPGRAQA